MTARADQMNSLMSIGAGFHYREQPVDILTFLQDPQFLGTATRKMSAIYPGWIKPLAKMFRNDKKYLIVLTGAIGIGKSMVVCGYCLPYILYRVSCLKDPWKYFDKGPSGKMEVTFFNLTKNLSGSRGFAYLQGSLMASPWFQKRGVMTGGREPHMELELFRWVLASPYAKGFGTQGGNIVAAVMDEVDSPNESEGQRKRVLQAYEGTVRRFESRFVKDGASIGRLFLVASKQDELSFLEVFIEDMKGSERVRIFDRTQWEIMPRENYCGETFLVMAGDTYLPPKIITPEEKDQYIKDGMRILSIPVEHRFDFERDIVGALRDLAGLAVRGLRKHKLIPAARFIKDCMDETKVDPVSFESIYMGLLDEEELIQYIDLNKICIGLEAPRAIHVDIAFAQDALGFACSTICGWTEMDVETDDGTFLKQKMPVVETDFCFRVVAKEGDRIPLHKVRKLILNLKAQGLNIKKVIFDLRLASEDTIQILTRAGIDAGYLSVDKDIKPYLDFKNLLFEGRWVCHKHEYLAFELRHLEFDRDKHKIDHPDKVKDIEILADGGIRDVVMVGSKDIADAVVGSVTTILTLAKQPLIAEQYVAVLQALKHKGKPIGFKGDWFITDDKKKALGSDVLVGGVRPTTDNVQKMKKALDDLKKGKGRGPTGIL